MPVISARGPAKKGHFLPGNPLISPGFFCRWVARGWAETNLNQELENGDGDRDLRGKNDLPPRIFKPRCLATGKYDSCRKYAVADRPGHFQGVAAERGVFRV